MPRAGRPLHIVWFSETPTPVARHRGNPDALIRGPYRGSRSNVRMSRIGHLSCRHAVKPCYAMAAKTQGELDTIPPDLKDAIRDRIRYVRAPALEMIPKVFGKDNAA
jgi:hypothetical protein